MPTYTVTSKDTGQAVYRYSADSPVEWSGMEFITHDHTADTEKITDVIPYMKTSRRLTKLAFIGRLGNDFRSILSAAKVSVDIELFVKMLDWATPDADGTSVDLDDARVAGALQMLEVGGLIGVGRATEILNGN